MGGMEVGYILAPGRPMGYSPRPPPRAPGYPYATDSGKTFAALIWIHGRNIYIYIQHLLTRGYTLHTPAYLAQNSSAASTLGTNSL